ncbi:MAG TPA: hypothetical protein VGJ18_19810 [Gemmatimonadaceae bacterium]
MSAWDRSPLRSSVDIVMLLAPTAAALGSPLGAHIDRPSDE